MDESIMGVFLRVGVGGCEALCVWDGQSHKTSLLCPDAAQPAHWTLGEFIAFLEQYQ